MFDLQNSSGLPASLSVHEDIGGTAWLAVTIKATFAVERGTVVIVDQQEPILHVDSHWGEPGESSINLPADVVPFKPATDIILVGSAYAPAGQPAREVDVTVSIGQTTKTVRVFGDRKWRLGLFGYRPSAPIAFTCMPLVYERAFGGADRAHQSPKRHDWDPRNPVGRGLHARRGRGGVRGSPLPNLEDPRHPIRNWRNRPTPAGFGAISPSWEPRLQLAGTYDDNWRERHAPLLPSDFDARFFQCAHPDLIAPGYLKGDERVRVVNATPDGEWDVRLPALAIGVAVHADHGSSGHVARLDTVVVRPDDRRINLIWRCMVPIRRKVLEIKRVIVFSAPLDAVAELEPFLNLADEQTASVHAE
ncbi:MAG: DUF2169 domain-containing protein [Gemmatimonadaceae bacterium]